MSAPIPPPITQALIERALSGALKAHRKAGCAILTSEVWIENGALRVVVTARADSPQGQPVGELDVEELAQRIRGRAAGRASSGA